MATIIMMTEREKNVFKAKLARTVDRNEEMVEFMKKVAYMKAELTPEERDLLSEACNSVVDARREAWKTITRIEKKEATEGVAEKHQIAKQYRERLELELRAVCLDIVNMINNYLIPCERSRESKMFNYQMLGDIHGYLAELPSASDDDENSAETSALAYKAAYYNAKYVLPPTHPKRLLLGLKLSMSCYKLTKSPEQACHYAEDAFDNAICEWDLLSEEDFEESDKIMEFLSEQLYRWRIAMKANAGGKHKKRSQEARKDVDGQAKSVGMMKQPPGNRTLCVSGLEAAGDGKQKERFEEAIKVVDGRAKSVGMMEQLPGNTNLCVSGLKAAGDGKQKEHPQLVKGQSEMIRDKNNKKDNNMKFRSQI